MITTDTKSKILSASIDLFAQNGFEKTTMRAIARKVGIQSASIYYYFDSKESLLKAIYDEFETNFAKYRNPPDDIWKASKEKSLSEVLSMLFYTFGSPDERDRMMAISRAVMSLQFEDVGAQELIERVMMQDALDYGVSVLEGLHALGIIRETDFWWTSFIFCSFAVAVFQENLRNLRPYAESNRRFKRGIGFLCSKFAEIMKT